MPYVIPNNNISSLCRFWYITTLLCTWHACDLQKSFSFNETVELTGRVHV